MRYIYSDEDTAYINELIQLLNSIDGYLISTYTNYELTYNCKYTNLLQQDINQQNIKFEILNDTYRNDILNAITNFYKYILPIGMIGD